MQIIAHQNAPSSVITVTDTATALFTLMNTAGSVTNSQAYFLTPSETQNQPANTLVITAVDGAIRVGVGITPTASLGQYVAEGRTLVVPNTNLSAIKIIRAGSSNVSCSILLGKSFPMESVFEGIPNAETYVVAPDSNTDGYIPQWDGTNTQTLKNGLAAPAGGFASATAVTSLENDRTILKEPTGFTVVPSRNYDPATQKITLTGAFKAYYRGVDVATLDATFVNGWVSTAHANTAGHTYFLYFNGTSFAWTTDTFPGYEMVLIASVNYGASNKYALNECHGLMSWQDHKEFHETIGTYKSSGGTFPSASYSLSSTTAADRRLNIDQTVVQDEDSATTLPALTSETYTQYYLSGASIGTYALGATDIIPLSTNNPYYNTFSTPNWEQTLMPANSVATIWIYALPVTDDANSQAYRYLFVQPQWITQATAASAGAITTAVNTEALRLPSELNLGTLTAETPELVCIGKIIIAYTGSNWTLRAVTVLTGNKFSQIGSPSGNYLSTVATGTTLTGDGTGASPLAVANPVTPQAVGFTIAGGSTSKTLTVPLDASVSGTNTGDNASNSTCLALAGGTMTGKTITAGTTEVGKTYTPATGAQTVALDCAVNNMHIVSGHANGTAITFTVANATNSQPFIVIIKQGAGTVSTISSWFAGISWCGGSAPTLTATLSKQDTYGFVRTGADTYIGYVVGQNA